MTAPITELPDLEAAALAAENDFQLAQQTCDECALLLQTAIQDRADFMTLYADKFSRTFLQEWQASKTGVRAHR